MGLHVGPFAIWQSTATSNHQSNNINNGHNSKKQPNNQKIAEELS